MNAPSLHPWEASYPDDVRWDASWKSVPLQALMDGAVERFADRPCCDFLGRSQTYGEIGSLINRAASGLRSLGVGRGVRVGLCLPNTPYSIMFYYGILKAGGTVVNINPLYSRQELEHIISDAGIAVIVTVDLKVILSKMSHLFPDPSSGKIVICPMLGILPPFKAMMFRFFKGSELSAVSDDKRHITYARLMDNDGVIDPPDVDPDRDIALLQYTGGTTGIPKGAMLTHANLVANAQQIRIWAPDLKEGEERFLVVLPLFHAFAMTVAMNLPILIGAEMILLPRFDLVQLLKIMDARKPTRLVGVPTLFGAIANAPDVARHDLRSLRSCICGGAPLPLPTRERFEGITGCLIVEGYGLSECSPVVACNPLGMPGRAGSVGLPLPGTRIAIRRTEAPHDFLGMGETGEICVKGPQVMAGYWNKPDDTRAALQDGWFYTGDMGYMDTDGFVCIVDRIKDLIICSGYKVYPKIIEDAIAQHPDVDEVTVIGIPDDYRGQTPKAFIKLRSGTVADKDTIQNFLVDRLSPIEQPTQIEFRDSLPKTMVGKLSKKELIAEEAARAAPQRRTQQ